MTGVPPPAEQLSISVVIPTIGRPEMLEDLLRSLACCRPLPDEVIVVDQSTEVASLAEVDGMLVRTIPCRGTGRGLGCNVGLRAAHHPFALMIDDDMTASPDWVAVAAAHLAACPDDVITGRVLAAAGAGHVPATIDDPEPRMYGRRAHPGVLYAGNMGVSVRAALELGGFDERMVPSAEDCDFAYRWLRSGRRIAYVPQLTTWHRDWRDAEQITALYAGYALGLGRFYAKFLRRRDPWIMPFVMHGMYAALRLRLARRTGDRDPADDAVAALPGAVWRGWRELRPGR